jgi:NADPH:quinone reductase-like Zn-dependent oxidoreductase
MKALIQKSYGAPGALAVGPVDDPEVGPGQVLVRIRAAGVNPGDWAIASGLPYIARPVYGLGAPKNAIRGSDLAGVVEAIGSGVTRFQPGDEVFGWADGTFADLAVTSEDALAHKPARTTFEQAAAMPESGFVALQAVRDHGRAQPGQQVLINGASGGIGSLAVQLAKWLGAEVTAVASTPNVELLRSLGADHVIDYRREDFTKGGKRYDLILDNASKQPVGSLRRALTPSGALIPNGGNFQNRWFASAGRLLRLKVLSRFTSQRFPNFLVKRNQPDLELLRQLLEAGTITPVVGQTFPLARAAEALHRLGTGHASGKVVIVMDDVRIPHSDVKARGRLRSSPRRRWRCRDDRALRRTPVDPIGGASDEAPRCSRRGGHRRCHLLRRRWATDGGVQACAGRTRTHLARWQGLPVTGSPGG